MITKDDEGTIWRNDFNFTHGIAHSKPRMTAGREAGFH
jgi:hypothetical protein